MLDYAYASILILESVFNLYLSSDTSFFRSFIISLFKVQVHPLSVGLNLNTICPVSSGIMIFILIGFYESIG